MYEVDILIVPAMLAADFLLHLIYHRCSPTAFDRHYEMPKLDHYPTWWYGIDPIQWFDYRCASMALGATAFLILADRSELFDANVRGLLLGFAFGVLCISLGRRIENLMSLQQLNRDERMVAGKLLMSSKYMVGTSQSGLAGKLPLFLIFGVVAPGWITLGMLSGWFSLWLINLAAGRSASSLPVEAENAAEIEANIADEESPCKDG